MPEVDPLMVAGQFFNLGTGQGVCATISYEKYDE